MKAPLLDATMALSYTKISRKRAEIYYKWHKKSNLPIRL